jgi:hypothetical protein
MPDVLDVTGGPGARTADGPEPTGGPGARTADGPEAMGGPGERTAGWPCITGGPGARTPEGLELNGVAGGLDVAGAPGARMVDGLDAIGGPGALTPEELDARGGPVSRSEKSSADVTPWGTTAAYPPEGDERAALTCLTPDCAKTPGPAITAGASPGRLRGAPGAVPRGGTLGAALPGMAGGGTTTAHCWSSSSPGTTTSPHRARGKKTRTPGSRPGKT